MSSKFVVAELAHAVEKLRKETRLAKTVDGERVKRPANHYAEFVSKHINYMAGSTPQMRMKEVAKLYRGEHDGRKQVLKREHRKNTEPEREFKLRPRKTVGNRLRKEHEEF
jgi:hypothetical protein